MKPLDPQSRRLLDEVSSGDTPPPELEAQLWQRLGPRLSEALPPTAAAASHALTAKSSLLLGSGTWLKLIATGIFASAVATGAVYYGSQTVEQAAPAEQPDANPERPDVLVDPGPRIVESSTLLAETQLLARAQRALGAGKAPVALRLLEEHARSFPSGALAQERDAARAIALCTLKRWPEARRSQQQFRQAWPGSPMTERVRHACAALSDSGTSPETRSKP